MKLLRDVFTPTSELIALANTGCAISLHSRTGGFNNQLVTVDMHPCLSPLNDIVFWHFDDVFTSGDVYQPMHGDGDVDRHVDNLMSDHTLLFVMEGSPNVIFDVDGDQCELLPGDVILFDHTKHHSIINETNDRWSMLSVTD